MKRKDENPIVVPLHQKIGLIVFGIALFFILLEAGLRIAGFTILSLQEYRNKASLRHKDTYRILCLGESTTQNQYPSLLEKELNKRYQGMKFSVIDKGVSGANTSVILPQLEANIDKYKPDMVITMMGINDMPSVVPSDFFTRSGRQAILTGMRTYKLAKLLSLHMTAKAEAAGWHIAKHDDTPQLDLSAQKEPQSQSQSSLDDLLPPEFKDSNEAALFELAQSYLRQGKNSQAEAAFMRVLSLNPDNIQACLQMGTLCKHTKRYPESEAFFRHVLELNPYDEEAYVGLGATYRVQNRVPEAKECFEQALRINPNNSAANIWMGRIYRFSGNLSQAEQCFNKVLQMQPQNDEAYLGIGIVYRLQNRLTNAEQAFLKAIEINPDNEQAYVNLAEFHLRMGNFYAAEAYFQESLRCNKFSYWPYAGLAYLYQSQKDLPNAEKLFKQYIKLMPRDDKGYRVLATLYTLMGQPELSEEYQVKAEELRKDYYNPVTISNYQRVREIIDQRGITHLCMQYPMRSLEPLQEILYGYGDIIFVDNENIFKDAVKDKGCKEYFTDIFAGDFGHCNIKGNQLLAQNIADVILKELFQE